MKSSFLLRRRVLHSFVVIGASALFFPAVSPAATVTLTGNNGFGQNGLTGTANWPAGQAPVVSNVNAPTTDYSSGAFQIRTETASGNVAITANFLGQSLTLASGGSLANKGGNGSVITIADFRIDGGTYFNNPSGNPTSLSTLNGALTVGSLGATLSGDSGGSARQTTFNMNISGTGPVFIANASTATGTNGRTIALANRITFAGINTYTGNTTIGNANPLATWARLDVEAGSSIGDINSSSTVTVLATGLLNFSSINNMGVNQSLWLDSNLASLQHIGLNYAGSMLLGETSLSFDGGTTFAVAGTYGAIGSGAMFESDFFTGMGTITVVPEPAHVSLAILGGLGVILLARSRRAKAVTSA